MTQNFKITPLNETKPWEAFCPTKEIVKELPAFAQQQVSQIFSKQNQERNKKDLPPLTNGTMIRVVGKNANSIICEAVPYAYFIAARSKNCTPDTLAALLESPYDTQEPLDRFCASSLSGAIITNDGDYLFGKRAERVTQFPGKYELCPSGGIKTEDITAETGKIDFTNALKRIFTKETGIPWNTVEKTQTMAIIETNEVIEPLITIQLGISTPEALTHFEKASNDGYTEIKPVSKSQLRTFLKTHNDEVIPSYKKLRPTLEAHS
jgi:hypothetical protein